MDHRATPKQIERVVDVIGQMGYRAKPMPGRQRTAIGLVGNDGRVPTARFEGLDGVREVIRVSKPYKQVSRSGARKTRSFLWGPVWSSAGRMLS